MADHSSENKLKELGIELPVPVTPQFSYVPVVITGNLLFLSGQVAFKDGAL